MATALQAFTAWWATELERVLMPGAYVAAFGAPRTVHRLVAGIEDAGLEVRDQLLWCFGGGVPKSRRLPGGLSTALTPAYEPIVLARKPFDRATPTTMANVARYATGALNIDARRVRKPCGATARDGFWPANLALGHERDCDAAVGDCVPACVVTLLDRLAAPGRAPDAPPFSRLFYAGKASRAEREAGLKRLAKRSRSFFSEPTGGLARTCIRRSSRWR